LLRKRFGVSERRACKVTGQPRSTQRSSKKEPRDADDVFTDFLKGFALAHPRQGYKKAYRAAREAGYGVNLKRIHRLWQKAGLKVPFKKKRKRSSGHGIAMGAHQPVAPNVTWAMDFQFDQTSDGKVIKLLNIIDEYSRECLTSFADRSINAQGVIAVLDGIVAERGAPKYIRADNGPEFIAHVLETWCKEMEVTMYFIEPGSPWQNGKCESFNSRLRDELLNGELFNSVAEAQLLHDRYREEYNLYRAHSSLGYLSPIEFLNLAVGDQRRVLTSSAKRRGWYAKEFFRSEPTRELTLVS